jgi:hypothetical protein
MSTQIKDILENPVVAEMWGRLAAMERLLKFLVASVNFDIDPAGNKIADGTRLDGPTNPYSSLGISFLAVSAPGVWARSSAYSISKPNVVSAVASPVDPGMNEIVGKIQVNFASPVSSVSIEAIVATPQEMLGPPGPAPYLNAYDSKNNLVASAQFPPNLVPDQYGMSSQPASLVVTSNTVNISYVVFSCPISPGGNSLSAYFDNLTFPRFGWLPA